MKRWNYKLPRSLLDGYFYTESEHKYCFLLLFFCMGGFMGKTVFRGSYLLKSNLVNWDFFCLLVYCLAGQ